MGFLNNHNKYDIWRWYYLMTIYLVLALVIILPSLLYKPVQARSMVDRNYFGKRSRLETVHIFICFCFMMYLMAFRGDMSTDFRSYQYIWLDVQNLNSIKDFFGYNTVELGYVILNKIVLLFSDNFYILLFVCSLIILIPIISFTRYSPCAWLTLFLYITFGTYYQSFNIMRQMMAASIMLIGFKHIYSGNLKKTVFYSIVAALFHGSVLLYIPCYFMFRANTRKMKWWQMILLYGFLSVFILSFYTFYIVYFKHEAGFQITELKAYAIKNIANSIIIFILCALLHILERNRIPDDERVFENITLVGLILWIIFLFLSTRLSYMMRLAGYFSPFMMLLIPYYLSKMELKGNRVIVTGLIVIFGIYSLMNGYGSTEWIGR